MKKQFILYVLIVFVAGCKQVYEPYVLKANNQFLVVDGFINTSSNGITKITLTRSRNLQDTLPIISEQNAEVFIESKSGTQIRLNEIDKGIYSSNPLNLNITDLYRLVINTNNGIRYESDYVPVKQSPLIDSITWKQDKDVTIYAHSHDEQNNTKYYRWDYLETWEYHSYYEGIWGYDNGMVFEVDSSTQKYKCWTNTNSTNIILGNTINLTRDVISYAPIAVIPQNSIKLGIRYSILVNQYALTKEAYEYWQILQKNTQQIGTLFDPQPSQLKGNIHCVTNVNEPVIGYLSAGSIQQKRIFINYNELSNWNTDSPPSPDCSKILVEYNSLNFPYFNIPDPQYLPYYFVTGGAYIVRDVCIDCTKRGGTNIKPFFW